MNMRAEMDERVENEELHYWKLVCENFRKVCALHKGGNTRMAGDLTSGRLSWLISRWSEASLLSPAEKRMKLLTMFDEEGRREGESDIARRVFSARRASQADRFRRTREALLGCGKLTGGIDLVEESRPAESPERKLADTYAG